MGKTAILIDNFIDTNGTALQSHVADTGQSWIFGGVDNGTIQSNKLSVAFNKEAYYTANVAFTNNYQYVTLPAPTGSFNSYFNIYLRFVPAGAFIRFSYGFGNFQFIDSLGFLENYAFTILDGDIVEARVTDTNHGEIYVNGVLKFTTSGTFGVTQVGTDIAIDFDNTSGLAGARAYENIEFGEISASPPIAPTLLTTTCVSGIGESALPNAAQALFIVDTNYGLAPLTVNFTDMSANTPTSWLWEFGDGTTSTSQNPSHIFSTAGTYTVRLTATNAYGSTTYQITIIVTTTPVVVPPTGGIIVPVGDIPGELLQSLLGQIGYYAVDTDGNQVKIYGTDGTLLKTFGGVGTGNGKFFMPTTCSVINGRQLLDRVVIEQG